eukprot:scaffold23959_cov19-Tisochrysis_lutea.AAC.3
MINTHTYTYNADPHPASRGPAVTAPPTAAADRDRRLRHRRCHTGGVGYSGAFAGNGGTAPALAYIWHQNYLPLLTGLRDEATVVPLLAMVYMDEATVVLMQAMVALRLPISPQWLEMFAGGRLSQAAGRQCAFLEDRIGLHSCTCLQGQLS